MKSKLSLLLIVLMLAACTPATQAPIESPADAPPAQAEIVPTATEVPETQAPSVPQENAGAPSEEIVCPTLLTPENGLVLPYSANILTFTFTPVEGAEIYLLSIETPVEKLITFQVENTLVERNLSTFTIPGENRWYVEVIDQNREVLCISEAFTFFAVAPACTTLLTPEEGTTLPAVGKVTFSWEPVPGAESYILRFILPNDKIVEFETAKTTLDRYMEAFGMSGEFEWNVIAFDMDENEICVSERLLFTKPSKPSNGSGGNGNRNDNSDGGCDPISGCGGEF
ncbi:MAG: hypothetical protein Kow002_13640 [Anaerolineales bacterium]